MLTRTSQWLTDIFQKAINNYLLLDPETQHRLQLLQSKVVKIELRGLDVILYLTFSTDGIQFDVPTLETHHIPADTVIKGTPLRLLQMSVSKDKRKEFFADDVVIEGNLELGQQTMDLFDKLEIDWEEHLSRVIGDTPANFIGDLTKKFNMWGKKTLDALQQNLNEFVHEEINLFPPAEALHDFCHDVDTFRMDVDRLEARIHKLEKNLHRGVR